MEHLHGAYPPDGTSAIAVDGSDNVFVAGQERSHLGTPVNAYAYGRDSFVAKLSGTGDMGDMVGTAQC